MDQQGAVLMVTMAVLLIFVGVAGVVDYQRRGTLIEEQKLRIAGFEARYGNQCPFCSQIIPPKKEEAK